MAVATCPVIFLYKGTNVKKSTSLQVWRHMKGQKDILT